MDRRDAAHLRGDHRGIGGVERPGQQHDRRPETDACGVIAVMAGDLGGRGGRCQRRDEPGREKCAEEQQRADDATDRTDSLERHLRVQGAGLLSLDKSARARQICDGHYV